MNNTLFSIDPIIQTVVNKIIKFDLSIVNINLFVSCTIRVGLYNDKGILVKNMLITLEGDDYSQWNYDDNYIIEFVKKKISSDII